MLKNRTNQQSILSRKVYNQLSGAPRLRNILNTYEIMSQNIVKYCTIQNVELVKKCGGRQ